MANWSAGYVTDVAYTHGAYRELSPHYLNLCAFAYGVRGPDAETGPLEVLELGCGQGVTASIVAAANPAIRYTAIDFNPSHIAGAQELAAQAGQTNIAFREADFASVAEDPTFGRFDIITLHGIYSWVSAENRAQICRIAREKLKPGGLFYVSYNAFPGWSPMLPIQRVLAETAASNADLPILERISASFDLVRRLGDVGARYLSMSPGTIERLNKIATLQGNYLAHEYLNRDWSALFFSSVAAEMAEAKLTFVGSIQLLDLIDPINITKPQADLLAEIKDPIRRESLRDIIINRHFRRDLFVKGALPISQHVAFDRWAGMRFALTLDRALVPLKVEGSLGEVTLQREAYEPILDAFADGPRTIGELFAREDVAKLGQPRIQQAIFVLVGAGFLHPCLAAGREEERRGRTAALNDAIMERAKSSAEIQYLASPVTGTGIPVERVSQLFLLGERAGEHPAAYAWKVLGRQGQRLVQDGKVLETEQENLAELHRVHEAFVTKLRPVLTQLGIA